MLSISNKYFIAMSLTILRSALLGLIILMTGLSRLVAQITNTDSTGLEKDVEIIQYDHLPTDLKINDILVAKGNKIWAATNKGV
jgi:hypothetical protein